MSQLIVNVTKVNEVNDHPNAERLSLAIIKGWQVVCQKGEFKKGDLVVYFPPDAKITQVLGERLGVWKYTKDGRVKAIRLRGQPSFGFAAPLRAFPELQKAREGQEVANILGVTKWEPSFDPRAIGKHMERAAKDNPMFAKYTDIENYGNFPDLIKDDEPVIATEKIHGTNSRVGIVEERFLWFFKKNAFMAGSHNKNRAKPKPGEATNTLYWKVLDIPGIKDMLLHIKKTMNANSVILYGEIYGKVQKLHYGVPEGQIDYIAFDIKVNDVYLNYSVFNAFCKQFKVRIVPTVAVGRYGDLKIQFDRLSSGKTLIKDPEGKPVDHIREGIVVKPLNETRDPKLGRVILKYKSADYVSGNFE